MLLLVDLDGVVYRGATPVPGVADVLKRRYAAGDRVMYVTNNSRSHRDEYRARLEEVGVPLGERPEESILSAARATALLLAEVRPVARRAMVFGGPGLERELQDVGIEVVPPTLDGLDAAPDAITGDAEALVRQVEVDAHDEGVRRGARFWATNRDSIYPAAERLMAGAGSMVAAVAYAAGREPDMAVGKPETHLYESAARVAGMPLSHAVVIGDNLATDIRAAHNVAARSVLMLTGVTSREELDVAPRDTWPTEVAADAAELEQALERLAASA